jgi:hypothetical protein
MDHSKLKTGQNEQKWMDRRKMYGGYGIEKDVSTLK